MTETPSYRTNLGVVRYERDGAIARIVLNWPERANAQSSEMVQPTPTVSWLAPAWEQMGMRQHLQLSADLMSVLEHTSDAQALRAELLARGRLPREQAGDG